MSRLWDADDDRLLRERYEAGEPLREIALLLGRSTDAVEARRRVLRIPHRGRPMRPWTPAEDAFLAAATRAGVPASEIGRRLNRTPDAVRRRREVRAITRPAHRPYTAADDEALRQGVAAGRRFAELAPRLGRTPGALRLRAQKLELIAPEPRRRWTRAEDDLLRHGYRAGWSGAGIHARLLPERTASAICARARMLGLSLYGRRWTADEERRLRELVERGLSTNLIAAELHRSREAVVRRCTDLALERPRLVAGRRRHNHRPWTPQEDERLRTSPDVDTQTLARLLGRSESAVRRRRKAIHVPEGSRSQHHTALVRDDGVTPAQVRQIVRAMPVTPGRLIALSARLQLPLSAIQQVVRRVESESARARAAGQVRAAVQHAPAFRTQQVRVARALPTQVPVGAVPGLHREELDQEPH
jgi:hypothetical protein